MNKSFFIYFVLFVINLNWINCLNVKKSRVKRIVGGVNAAKPPLDDPVVFTRLYSKDARVEGIRNKKTGLYSFYGIRYAEAPINENRFLRPQFKRLAGDVNATLFGPPCPQPDPYNPNRIVGNEDCLLLNIFTPQMPDETSGLPVIIWIHGGGFRYGSAAQYGPDPLTAQNVIFVPIQYRLGSLGILGDGTKEFSGNVALFDMMAAIRWVREYIKFFGGNSFNIKIMGQGSGATSASQLSISRLPRDLINGVIAMSGNALSQYSTDKTSKISVEEISQINNCPTTNETEIVHCLQTKSASKIIENDSNLQMKRLEGENVVKGLTGFVGIAPCVEQPDDKRGLPGMITNDPNDDIQKGNTPEIPLLLGVVRDETANGILQKEIESIWKSFDNFLTMISMNIGLDFKGLLNINNSTGQILPVNLPDVGLWSLSDYLNIPSNLSPTQILNKLIETTTDMFFNLPAYLSVSEWSKKAPSFLYRFEYKGELSAGKNLLSGLPLVSKANDKSNSIAHGDDLIYLFDICDIFGNPIKQAKLKNENDLKVQKMFTNLISEFAWFNISDSSKKRSGLFSNVFSKGSPYIKISNEISLESDFQFCQLSVMGAQLEALKTASCKVLTENLLPLTSLTGDLPNLSKTLNIDGLLPQGKQSPKTTQVTSKSKGLLGGIL